MQRSPSPVLCIRTTKRTLHDPKDFVEKYKTPGFRGHYKRSAAHLHISFSPWKEIWGVIIGSVLKFIIFKKNNSD